MITVVYIHSKLTYENYVYNDEYGPLHCCFLLEAGKLCSIGLRIKLSTFVTLVKKVFSDPFLWNSASIVLMVLTVRHHSAKHGLTIYPYFGSLVE